MRIYSNVAAPTTLAGAIGAADVSITLADATGYPAPAAGESALLQVEGELLEYTSLAGAVASGITRGVDGTTAAAHADGVAVAHVASGYDLADAKFGRRKYSGTTSLCLPGVSISGAAQSFVPSSGPLYTEHAQLVVRGGPIQLNSLHCYCSTVATVAGKQAEMALYEADRDWQPGRLIVGTAPFLVDAAGGVGEKIVSGIDRILWPGRYLAAFRQNGDAAFRLFRGTVFDGGMLAATIGGNLAYYLLTATGATFGTWDDPGRPINAPTDGSAQPGHIIFLKVTPL